MVVEAYEGLCQRGEGSGVLGEGLVVQVGYPVGAGLVELVGQLF